MVRYNNVDEFTRADSAIVGNGWVEDETAGVCSIDTNRAKIDGNSGNAGILNKTIITNSTPTNLSIRLSRDDTDADNTYIFYRQNEEYAFYIQLQNGDIGFNGTTIKIKTGYVANTMYKIEFKNINWVNYTLDIWLDDAVVLTTQNFNTNLAGMDEIKILVSGEYNLFVDYVRGQVISPPGEGEYKEASRNFPVPFSVRRGYSSYGA